MASATSPTIAAEITKFLEGNPDGFTEQDLKKVVIAGLVKSQKASKGKSSRGKKVDRDPDMPKRPKNAFMLFSDTVREEVRAELIAASSDGKIRVADVSKACGARWKTLSEDDKLPFVEEHKVASAAYKEAMNAYYLENPDKKTAKETTKKTSGAKKATKKTAFSTEDGLPTTPDGWAGAYSGYVLGSVKDPETGKNILKKFADFNEAIAEAIRLGDACGGITRTSRGYALRKGSTVTPHINDNTIEISWLKGDGAGVTAESAPITEHVMSVSPPVEEVNEEQTSTEDDEMPPLEEGAPVSDFDVETEEETTPAVVAKDEDNDDDEDDDEDEDEDDDEDEETECIPWEVDGTTYFYDSTMDVMNQNGDVIGKRMKAGDTYIIKRN